MKKTIVFLSIIICLLGHFSFSQNKMEFKDVKRKGDGRVVYFQISGIKNQEHLNEISNALSSDKNISSCNIYKDFEKKDACQLEMKNTTTDVAYVQNILKSKNADFDMASVLVGESRRHDGMPEHYPVFKDTGSPDVDNDRYDKEKTIWLKNYPKEVQILTCKNYYDVISNESFYLNEQPVLIDTGNKELDEKKFEKRKLEWNKSQKQ